MLTLSIENVYLWILVGKVQGAGESASSEVKGMHPLVLALCEGAESLDEVAVEEVLCKEAEVSESGVGDIWDDVNTLGRVRGVREGENWGHAERSRVGKRMVGYRWVEGELLRVVRNGTTRMVPHPSDRIAVTRRTHEDAGHFGRRRTAHLLRLSYWWRGMSGTVEEVLKECQPCDRVKAAFNGPSAVLNPLAIEGLFYRWGVDLFGPFDTSTRGNTMVMVCIEHYSKWAEVIPIPDKSAATCAAAFRQAVLGRFGSCAEVVTDCGKEWQGAFEQLLKRNLIDHRMTSPDRPQANGLTERAVQTFKRCVRTYVEASGYLKEWDTDSPYIQLGYNLAIQRASGFSPVQVLFGR